MQGLFVLSEGFRYNAFSIYVFIFSSALIKPSPAFKVKIIKLLLSCLASRVPGGAACTLLLSPLGSTLIFWEMWSPFSPETVSSRLVQKATDN
jgi:hypothetical protein